MKKWPSRVGGVDNIVFGIPMLHGKQKKNDSHAAWECQKCFLRHLSSENDCMKNDDMFVMINLGGFGTPNKWL